MLTICKLLAISFLLSGCAFFKYGFKKNVVTDRPMTVFALSDESGKFLVYREVGLKKNDKVLVVKRRVVPANDKDKEFEKSIAISEVGFLNKLPVLRPKVSQYTVWFEGKKYFTEMKINTKSRSIQVKMDSPEGQWSGKKDINFPRGTGVFCFFSQLTECVRTTGFFTKAASKGGGTMRFHIIFDGYPYFQEQYTNIPKKVFAKAKLTYDGRNPGGDRRFSLLFGEQTIFYFIDDRENLSKMFWVSQGLSMAVPNDQKS